jgi:hypothetical protein
MLASLDEFMMGVQFKTSSLYHDYQTNYTIAKSDHSRCEAHTLFD